MINNDRNDGRTLCKSDHTHVGIDTLANYYYKKKKKKEKKEKKRKKSSQGVNLGI